MQQVEVTVGPAHDLKNVNWRNGDLKPYVVLWINDDGPKCSTRVDLDDDGENPVWDEKLLVPLPPSATRIHDAVLNVDVVHANAAQGVKPLVGSARLPLRDFLDGKQSRTLRLKRPSGRPQGRLDVRVAIKDKEPSRYRDATPYPAPAPYYAAPPPAAYAAPPPAAYAAAPPPPTYVVASAPPQPVIVEKGSSKMGVGTGLAVGAAAGVLGGLALAGGASYLENRYYDDDDDDDDDYY